MNLARIAIKVSNHQEEQAALVLLSKLSGLNYSQDSFDDDYCAAFPYITIVDRKVGSLSQQHVNFTGKVIYDYTDIAKFLMEFVLVKQVEVPLNEEHRAIVSEKEIKVGCQTFPVEILDKLQAAVQECQGFDKKAK